MTPRRFLLLLTILCLAPQATRANILSQMFTVGCNEYMFEQDDSDYSNQGTRWRLFYRCCGQSCFSSIAWTNKYGPVNPCGNGIIMPPSPYDSHWVPVQYNSNGDILVPVESGHGGIISTGSSTSNCYPFTANGGNYIMIPKDLP